MNILRADQQQLFTTPNAQIIPLATLRLGARQSSVIHQKMAPGHQNPPHTQTHEEIMYMLSGTVTVNLNGETVEVRAGDTLIIPPLTPHSLANSSAAEAEWLIVSPAAMRFQGPDGQPMQPQWAE